MAGLAWALVGLPSPVLWGLVMAVAAFLPMVGVAAVVTMVTLVYFPPLKHAWRNLILAIAGFGVATLIFGVSTNFWISVVALFFTGAFDSISVVIRQTVLRF